MPDLISKLKVLFIIKGKQREAEEKKHYSFSREFAERLLRKDSGRFPIQKWAIFRKVKACGNPLRISGTEFSAQRCEEIKGLCLPPLWAGTKKGPPPPHFWRESGPVFLRSWCPHPVW